MSFKVPHGIRRERKIIQSYSHATASEDLMKASAAPSLDAFSGQILLVTLIPLRIKICETRQLKKTNKENQHSIDNGP